MVDLRFSLWTKLVIFWPIFFLHKKVMFCYFWSKLTFLGKKLYKKFKFKTLAHNESLKFAKNPFFIVGKSYLKIVGKLALKKHRILSCQCWRLENLNGNLICWLLIDTYFNRDCILKKNIEKLIKKIFIQFRSLIRFSILNLQGVSYSSHEWMQISIKAQSWIFQFSSSALFLV